MFILFRKTSEPPQQIRKDKRNDVQHGQYSSYTLEVLGLGLELGLNFLCPGPGLGPWVGLGQRFRLGLGLRLGM